MNYYGVTRSTDHLAHYGVKGMKWGVRRAIARGDQKAVDRHFRKAAKKLAKLQDIGLHSGKYTAKAAAYGAAAAGVGTLAVGGTGALSNAVFKLGKWYSGSGIGSIKTKHNLSEKIKEASSNIEKFGNRAYVKKPKVSYFMNEAGEYELIPGTVIPKTKTEYKTAVSGNTLYRLGTGAVAVGLAAKGAQNAYRAANSAKYREKASRFKNEMDNAFKGTKYEGLYVASPRRKKRRR